MSKDDEIARKLQEHVDTERPETVTFNGPGPYELPKCGSKVSLFWKDRDYFVLQLQTETDSQRLFLPISARAMSSLKALIDHAIANHGVGQTRN